MIKTLIDWFNNQTEAGETTPEIEVELATAVLMYEIMRADDTFEQSERETLEHRLSAMFHLTDEQHREIIEMATSEAHQAADFVQFTRVINAKFEMSKKREILDALWSIAYADGKLDAHEEHLIRRIADLLHVPHSEFIQSKLRVQDDSQ